MSNDQSVDFKTLREPWWNNSCQERKMEVVLTEGTKNLKFKWTVDMLGT